MAKPNEGGTAHYALLFPYGPLPIQRRLWARSMAPHSPVRGLGIGAPARAGAAWAVVISRRSSRRPARPVITNLRLVPTDQSRGYGLKLARADFLRGRTEGSTAGDTLLLILRLVSLLPPGDRAGLRGQARGAEPEPVERC
jgi:hypothetical protein